ncbi:hypothetical protein [Arthrobacter ulcerisalmonis]|nr:hypothetical protein [Arthrobacter ulcerisalmonis]
MQQTAESVDAALTKAAGLRHAEFTSVAKLGTPAGNGIVFGAFTADTSVTFNNTFVAPDTTAGNLKILETGVYTLTLMYLPSSTPGSVDVGILNATTATKLLVQNRPGTYGAVEVQLSGTFYLPANTVLNAYVASSTGVTFGSRLRVTKIQNA